MRLRAFTAICLLTANAVAQTTITPGIGLQIPGFNSSNWQIPFNYDFNLIDQMLSGQALIPALHVTGNFEVDGTVTANNLQFTPQQIQNGLGFTPLKPANNLNDVQSVATTLQNLGTVSKSYIDSADSANAQAASNAQSAAGTANTAAQNAATTASNAATAASTAQTAANAASTAAGTAQSTANTALSTAQAAIPAASAPLYAAGTTYAMATPVKDAAGNHYISLQGGNKGNTPNPAADTAYWALTSAAPVTSLPYTAITNPPTIPSKTSQLTNDAAFITASQAPVQTVNGIAPTNGNVTVTATVNAPASAAYLGTNSNGQLIAASAPVAAAAGSAGAFQVAGSNGTLAAASYTPLNKAGDSMTGQLTAQAIQAQQDFRKLPTISPTHQDFTAAPYNCSNAADPSGVNDSTCAINAALTYANSYANTLKGTNSNASGLHACVLLDPGFYKVSGNGIQLNESYCLKGWSPASTVIASTDPTRSAITYGGVNGVPYSGTSVYVPYAFLGDLDIVGNGKATTGNLLEIDLSFLILNNVQFFNTGGRAFQANGGERLFGQNLSFYDTRLPMMLGGDDNESTFVNLNGLDNGHTNDAGPSGSGFSKWCYGVNCTNGSFTAAGTNAAPATLYPPTLADVTNQKSVNVRFIGGDMKGNSINAAFRNVSGQQFVIDNMYTEAPVVFPAANMGASYIQGGVTPRTTLTSGFTSTTYGPSTVYLATIADSSQMPLYFGLATDAESYVGTQNQYTPLVMYPSDYVPGSTTASTTCSGLNKGSYEIIFSGATYGGNNIAIFGRSSGGTNMPSGVTNYNWGSSCTTPPSIEDYTPANAQVPSMTVQGHMNNVQGTPTSNGYTYVVNSGPQCAGEVIAGVCADAPGGFFTAPNATGDPLANISAGTITIGDQTSMVNGSNNLYAGSVSVVRRTNINVIGGSIAKDASINEPFAAVLTTAANSPIGVANTEYISLNSLTSGEYVTAYPDANNVPVQTELYAPYVHETWNTSTGFWQRDACRFTSGYYGCGLMSNNWWIMANSPVTAFAMNFTGSQFNWLAPSIFNSTITSNGGIIYTGTYTYPSGTSIPVNQVVHAAPAAAGTSVFTLPAAITAGTRERITLANTNPFAISTPTGTSLYINNTKYISNGGTSTLFPGYLGTLEFTADAYNQWVSSSYQPEIGPATIASGAGFASATLTLAANSSVHAGQFSFTIPSGSTGTAGSVGLTVTNTVPTAQVAKQCRVDFVGGSYSGYQTAYPTANGFSWTPAVALASGSYSASWSCTF